MGITLAQIVLELCVIPRVLLFFFCPDGYEMSALAVSGVGRSGTAHGSPRLDETGFLDDVHDF